MSIRRSALLVALLVPVAGVIRQSQAEPADLILTNGTVITVDAQRHASRRPSPFASGKIVFVGVERRAQTIRRRQDAR